MWNPQADERFADELLFVHMRGCDIYSGSVQNICYISKNNAHKQVFEVFVDIFGFVSMICLYGCCMVLRLYVSVFPVTSLMVDTFPK